MTSFESALAKFNRANQQAEALEGDLISLSDLESYTITKDIDSATGYQIYRFANVPPIPDDLSFRVGEILYNFRCSLDHIIWEIVQSAGGVPTFRNEFPIFIDATRYDKEKRSKLKGVPDTVIPTIDALQPCNSTGENDFWWYLWYLHQLGNADKHRHLLLTRRTLRDKLRLSYTGAEALKLRKFNTTIENGAVFLILETNMDVQVHPTIDILFSNAPTDIRSDLPVGNIIGLIKTSVWEVLHRFHIK